MFTFIIGVGIFIGLLNGGASVFWALVLAIGLSFVLTYIIGLALAVILGLGVLIAKLFNND